MCWITMQKWRTRPRIAKKKIEVWKVYIKRSNELLVSPYQRERIYLDMRNRQLSIGHDLHVLLIRKFFLFFNKMVYEIHEGYHSYKKGCLRLIRTKISDSIELCGRIPEEYTCFRDSDRKYVVVQCFIPVGAEYYISEFGHYVSNKIIIGDEIPLDKIPLNNIPLLQR